MLIAKKTLTDQGQLNKNVIVWAIETRTQLAIVNRALSIDKTTSNDKINFIDDITQDELNAGFQAVKEVLVNEDEIELLKEYFSIFCEVSSEDAKIKYAKELKKDEINKERDNAIGRGVTYKGKVFQSERKDINLLINAISIFSISKQFPNDFVWISKDNKKVPFTLNSLIELGVIMENNIKTNTIKARDLKDKIQKAQSMEEIEVISWNE